MRNNRIPKETLEQAFEVLLKKQLSSYDSPALYELYSWDDQMTSDFLEYFKPEDIEALEHKGGAIPSSEYDSGEANLYESRYSTVGGYCVIDEGFDSDIDLAEEVVKKIKEVAKKVDHSFLIRQIDFAHIVKENRIDLKAFAGSVSLLDRVETDGSLFDAMSAATFTMNGYHGLVSLDYDKAEDDEDEGVDPEWWELLRMVKDRKVHNHLCMLCLTGQSARCDGAFYSENSCPFAFKRLARLPGYQLVTSWEYGEGQGAIALFQVKKG